MPKLANELFIDRELSWLEFNSRVLAEAQNPDNPLLERLKFFIIFSTNLDEYFEVRVAGFKQQIESGVVERNDEGMTPAETFQAIVKKVRQLVDCQYKCWRKDIAPALAQNGIQLLEFEQLTPQDIQWMDAYYKAEVRPVLTPLAIDPAHPFPQLFNKSLNLIVEVETDQPGDKKHQLAIVQVPRNLPRLIRLPRISGTAQDYLLLERLISHYLGDLFAGMTIRGHWLFRLTRNSELYIDEEETANLLKAVENELQKRRRGAAVRLEVEGNCPEPILHKLLGNLNLTQDDLYRIHGPLSPGRFMVIYNESHTPELRDPSYFAPTPRPLSHPADIFAAIRKQDVLLHHPYDNFEGVAAFLEQAAEDPNVLAIKQTLYRTGGDPRIVGALMRAVNNGKQVTAVVELKARFDEANNIEWARRLEEAGVHVVYGLVRYKIHGKICLVVRREELGIRRYVHVSTGNYNPITSRIYSDLGLLTCHPDFGEDATNLFNLLTGICQFQGMRRFLVAPFELHERILALIERETRSARQGLPARIIAKMNSLVDPQIIKALYNASAAGVTIDLIVRGICCLRPQVKGLSERITVRGVVDRFLEHSRIFYFENACQPEVYLGSADWMPRNFFGRVEIVFPILDGMLRERIRTEILETALKDNVKSWFLNQRGEYARAACKPGEEPFRSQTEFMRMAIVSQAAPVKARGKFPQIQILTGHDLPATKTP
jgi:polyphosphate kinase